MNKLRQLLVKHRTFVLYALFGIITTAVNIAAYRLCYSVLGVPNVPSTIVAWALSVAVAFITNKLWVFNSRAFDRRTLARELTGFVGARLLTGALDVLIMYLAVDVFRGPSMLWKLVSNAIVILLNYIASKLVIFRKKAG